MHATRRLGLRGSVMAVVAMAAGGCTPEAGEVYNAPVREVRQTLARIELPPLVFGTVPPAFRVAGNDPETVVGVVSRGRDEMLRYVLTLSPVTDRSTRVRVEVVGPKTGAFGDVDRKLADSPAIRALYVAAMEERVAASLLHRPFDMAKLYPIMTAAAVANAGGLLARADQAAEAAQKHDRDNIAKAYGDEAAGDLARR